MNTRQTDAYTAEMTAWKEASANRVPVIEKEWTGDTTPAREWQDLFSNPTDEPEVGVHSDWGTWPEAWGGYDEYRASRAEFLHTPEPKPATTDPLQLAWDAVKATEAFKDEEGDYEATPEFLAYEAVRLAESYPRHIWEALMMHGTIPDEVYALMVPSQFDQLVEEAAQRIRVRDAAQALVRSEKAAHLAIPSLQVGQSFLAETIADDEFIVEGLLHTGGNMMQLAQRKAGKTTLGMNLIRSLVDGDDFLDTWAVSKTRRVAFLDFELSDAQAQRWFATQEIQNKDAWARVGLRGKGASFNILDDKTRARWADMLQGYDVLILDPLRPLLDALGLDEKSEVGVMLQAFDALKVEAGISEGVVVHHMGWEGTHGRGDSRIEDWPDSIVKLRVENPDDAGSFRFLRAIGRDVDVQEGLVSKYAGNRLAFAPNANKAKSDRLIDRLVEFITENPGCTSGALEDVEGVTKNNRKALVTLGVKDDRIRTEEKGTATFHYPSE